MALIPTDRAKLARDIKMALHLVRASSKKHYATGAEDRRQLAEAEMVEAVMDRMKHIQMMQEEPRRGFLDAAGPYVRASDSD